MKITFVEERNGNSLNEKSFVQEIIRVGRDPEHCDVVFEQKLFPMVSRRHAELREKDGKCLLVDVNSSYGTFLDGNRVTRPVEVKPGSTIQFGINGPVLRLRNLEPKEFFEATIASAHILPETKPETAATPMQSLGTKTPFAGPPLATPIAPAPPVQIVREQTGTLPETLLGSKIDLKQLSVGPPNAAQQPQLLLQTNFNRKNELTIGRASSNDIHLEGLQISKQHARLVKTANSIVIEDSNSTNGVYLGGKRLSNRHVLAPQEIVQIGAFQLYVDHQTNVFVFDTRSKSRIDALALTKTVKNNRGAGTIKLLDDVSLTIQPNEFVGLLGPSGAGKSTLMDALNGMRPASSGNVFLNNLDFYSNLDALKQNIGYVPQDDRLHRELTVYQTLYYVARLRLSRDASREEIVQNISEVLESTGLAERRNVCIADLSGGQRKRVSIAVELITKPSIIFLDEPTSGLDPAAEERIMKLFRRLAEAGRTVVLTTHAMENVRLFDKIVILMRGKLVFYGAPNEALKYLQAASFKELYDKLERPIEERLTGVSVASQTALKKEREQLAEETAENWKQKFVSTEQYRRNVYEPLKQFEQTPTAPTRPQKRRLGILGTVQQTVVLSRRYAEVLWQDKLNLTILFLQAPIIAFMTFLVMNATAPRDFVYFVLSLVAIWFGTSVAAREIVRERAVFKRERMVNLNLLPYLASKLSVLGVIVAVQCLLLFVPLKFLDVAGMFKMPGELFGLPQLLTMFLTAGVGIALGLLISALVKTSEMATSLVPLVLIPQILFSGLIGVPHGASKIISLTMPTAWSFDSIKQHSGLDTIEPEGSNSDGPNGGLGLYKAIEKKNDELIDETKENIDQYKRDMRNYLANIDQGIKSSEPKPPEVKTPEKLPENKSDYVNFLHPWMNVGLNEIVLLVMFAGLMIITLLVMRSRDMR